MGGAVVSVVSSVVPSDRDAYSWVRQRLIRQRRRVLLIACALRDVADWLSPEELARDQLVQHYARLRPSVWPRLTLWEELVLERFTREVARATSGRLDRAVLGAGALHLAVLDLPADDRPGAWSQPCLSGSHP